ncbi:MAG: rod shape-determining protein, partial [Patescibacteria group bacterium]
LDLGTANTLIYLQGKGVVVNEASVVAINTRTDQILSIGEDAVKMIGKTPPHILATQPIDSGIISDFEAVEKMLNYFIEKVSKGGMKFIARPRVIASTPLNITGVEKKAIEDATIQAGARKVFLIEEPIAAAVGAKLPVQEASGSMIVNLGAGLTEIAVISLGGIVTSRSIKIAGNELNRNIVAFAEAEFGIIAGERTAEELKKKIGSAFPLKELVVGTLRGRDTISGLPKEININAEQVREAMDKSLKKIVQNIKDTLEITPPELVAEIYRKGIMLCGGGALMKNIDKYISNEIRIPVEVIDDPQTVVIRGVGLVLENFEQLKDILSFSARDDLLIK